MNVKTAIRRAREERMIETREYFEELFPDSIKRSTCFFNSEITSDSGDGVFEAEREMEDAMETDWRRF
jgi:hypothetical protein